MNHFPCCLPNKDSLLVPVSRRKTKALSCGLLKKELNIVECLDIRRTFSSLQFRNVYTNCRHPSPPWVRL